MKNGLEDTDAECTKTSKEFILWCKAGGDSILDQAGDSVDAKK